jgi:hypothetical protein
MGAHQLQSRRPAIGTPRADIRDSDFMRAVNSNVRGLADALLRREELAFFCECRCPTCYSAVWMSRAAFDATTAAGDSWLLLDGHESSAPWPSRPAPRRRARSLLSA